MTGTVITPVVLPPAPRQHDGRPAGLPGTRRPLPLPPVPPPRTTTAVHGLAAVDRRGRIADRTVLHALGWQPGTRLAIRETHRLLLIQADAHGVFSVTNQGHLRLPASIRHHCSLVPGDRVLLAAAPDRGLLVVHPPAALDDMVAQQHANPLGGEPG